MTTNNRNLKSIFFLVPIFFLNSTWAQETQSYIVKSTTSSITIDGVLNETDWQNAEFTEAFKEPEFGTEVEWESKTKMLWDSQYIYFGFVCKDDDIWASLENRDDHLWDEENVEIFCDPDGDEKNYFEMEFNPLGTIFDQIVDRSWIEGSNNENTAWNMEGLLVATSVVGTINNPSDVDTEWFCEIAIPFEEFSQLISPLSCPPVDGDKWRVQLCKYNRERDKEGNLLPINPDLASWNQIGTNHFHVPEKFGEIIFSTSNVSTDISLRDTDTSPHGIEIIGNYPNPFSQESKIIYKVQEKGEIKIDILNINGTIIKSLDNTISSIGTHSTYWKNEDNAPGIYLLHIHNSNYSSMKKILIKE